MAYPDPQFTVQLQTQEVGSPSGPISLGTTTASSTSTATGTAGGKVANTFQFPVFKVPTKVLGIRVYGIAGPAANSSATLYFLNGTSTFGTCTALPATGTFVDAALTAVSVDSHGLETGAVMFTSTNGEILNNNVIIGTASAQALGSYAIDLITRGLFVT